MLCDEKGHDHDYITFANSPSHSHTRDSRDRMEVPDRNVKRSTELLKPESLHVHSLNGHAVMRFPRLRVCFKGEASDEMELDVRLSFSLSSLSPEKCTTTTTTTTGITHETNRSQRSRRT